MRAQDWISDGDGRFGGIPLSPVAGQPAVAGFGRSGASALWPATSERQPLTRFAVATTGFAGCAVATSHCEVAGHNG